MTKVLKQGPETCEIEITCHLCKTVFVATEDDLGIDKLKKDPNTYWFDGSAQSVDKYYAWCPNKCDLEFIPESKIPELCKRKAVRGR
jgi:hypothetical protein